MKKESKLEQDVKKYSSSERFKLDPDIYLGIAKAGLVIGALLIPPAIGGVVMAGYSLYNHAPNILDNIIKGVIGGAMVDVFAILSFLKNEDYKG